MYVAIILNYKDVLLGLGYGLVRKVTRVIMVTMVVYTNVYMHGEAFVLHGLLVCN